MYERFRSLLGTVLFIFLCVVTGLVMALVYGLPLVIWERCRHWYEFAYVPWIQGPARVCGWSSGTQRQYRLQGEIFVFDPGPEHVLRLHVPGCKEDAELAVHRRVYERTMSHGERGEPLSLHVAYRIGRTGKLHIEGRTPHCQI